MLNFVILFVCNHPPEVILLPSPEIPTPATSNPRDVVHQSFPVNIKSSVSKKISWSLFTPTCISSEASLPASSFNPFSFVCHSTVSGCPETASVAGPERLWQPIPGEKEPKRPTKGPPGPACSPVCPGQRLGQGILQPSPLAASARAWFFRHLLRELGWGLTTAREEKLATWVPCSAPQTETFNVMNTLWQCCPIYLAAIQFSCNFCTAISMRPLYFYPICLRLRDRPHGKVLLTPAFAIINPSALTGSRANTDYKTPFPI